MPCADGLRGIGKTADTRQQSGMVLDGLVQLLHEIFHDGRRPVGRYPITDVGECRMACRMIDRNVDDVDVLWPRLQNLRAELCAARGEPIQRLRGGHLVLADEESEIGHRVLARADNGRLATAAQLRSHRSIEMQSFG